MSRRCRALFVMFVKLFSTIVVIIARVIAAMTAEAMRNEQEASAALRKALATAAKES